MKNVSTAPRHFRLVEHDAGSAPQLEEIGFDAVDQSILENPLGDALPKKIVSV